jgi:hypothetical protein
MIRIRKFAITNSNLRFLNPKSGFGRFSNNPDFIPITNANTTRHIVSRSITTTYVYKFAKLLQVGESRPLSITYRSAAHTVTKPQIKPKTSLLQRYTNGTSVQLYKHFRSCTCARITWACTRRMLRCAVVKIKRVFRFLRHI